MLLEIILVNDKEKYFVNAFINEETNGIVIGNIIPRRSSAVCK